MQKNNIVAVFSVFFLSLLSPILNAENSDIRPSAEEIIRSQLIENSYVVTFKDPDEGFPIIVQAPEKDREIVPFGMHSTGQSKEEIAQYLDLKGEIVAIFDAINAIHVKVDAQEAARLSKLDYVLTVQQDTTSTLSGVQNNPGWGLDRIDGASANYEKALYNNGVLMLPIVASPTEPGAYQEAVFNYTEQEGWQLIQFYPGLLLDIATANNFWGGIKKVELIKTDSFPVQVFLKATITLGCEIWAGRIRYTLTGNAFNVFIYHSYEPCSVVGGASETFTKIIPLDIYALTAGNYNYSVNGNFAGTFNLAEDNEL